jgi:Fe-S oxidoreductase
LGFAEQRDLPTWRRDRFRDGEASRYADAAGAVGYVMLFADTFNRYFEPGNLRAALQVIAAAGRKPVLPRHEGRPLCCGRTYLAAGQIEKARAEARRTLSAFAGDAPLPCPEARALASRAVTLGEWMAREKISLRLRPAATKAHVHGHCHEKSFGAFEASLAALRQMPDLTVAPIASSCCGMAGAFGYQSETQDVSRAMAEADRLPAVRRAKPDELIVADGTSCRRQIADLSCRVARHSVRVLADALLPER